jgi:hypothetical protein
MWNCERYSLRLIAPAKCATSRLVKVGSGSLSLPPQHVGAVLELLALFQKPLRDLTSLFHSLSQMLREHRANSEMRANMVGEVRTTIQAPVCPAVERVGAKLLLPKVLGTRGAPGTHVVPAKDIEEDTLLGTKRARATAVNMEHAIVVFDRLVG